MKLTVLVDNNTYIDQYYLGEPALSIYIEDGKERILFDTGYSDAFIKNAEAMQIDLSRLTYIVLSHGHNDHTRGLLFLWERYNLKKVKLVAHPGVFSPKRYMGLDVGAPFTREDCLARGLQLIDGSKPVKITERLTFLGEIPRVTGFEAKVPIGILGETGPEDFVLDDSAISYEGNEGLFIITGCSHSGICNIVMHAINCSDKCCRRNKSAGHESNAHEVSIDKDNKDTYGSEKPVTGIIGGFHLLEQNRQLEETIHFLKQNTKGTLYPCHCVSLAAKYEMMKARPIAEVGVGLQLEADNVKELNGRGV